MDVYPERSLRVVAVPYPSSRVSPLEDSALERTLRKYLGALSGMVA
jgi:hypothetical protein